LRPLLLILVALALILLNGVFVAAEFAIVRVRRTRLEELAGQGVEVAKDAILIVDYVSEYLAVTQVGITVASLSRFLMSHTTPASRLPIFLRSSSPCVFFLSLLSSC
jgi:CBS domain containing-hemolysin-like protein